MTRKQLRPARVALPWLLLPLACAEHPPGAIEVDAQACVACHRADYESTGAPLHAGRFPTTCADCHATGGWSPALEGLHPERAFPLGRGPHGQFGCTECHRVDRGPSAGGANTDCTGCHTGAHASRPMAEVHDGVPDYAFAPEAPSFCLRCHPDGQADNHPEDRFPIRSGAHAPFACAECHDRAAGPDRGGQNTDCIGCHTGDHSRARMDDKHHEEAGYRWQADMPHFCLSCHPRGSGEDD